MQRFYLALFLSFLGFHGMKAQCPACSALTFSVNFSGAVDTAWALVNQTRSGNCCGDNNCVRFMVTLNPNADLLNFNVTNPSPSGSAFYSINCGSLVSIGTPVCVYGQTFVCVSYCKPGGDSPTYHLIQTKTVKASPDQTVRVGCAVTLTVTGMTPGTATWTSISPGAQGQYNSFLSCTNCTSTIVSPTTVVLPYIDYKVTGTPATACGGTSTDTVRVYITPGLTANITPTNAVVCSGGTGSVVLTASVSGGTAPYTYTWSNGPNTATNNVPVGNYTLLVKDQATVCAAVPVTVAVVPITTPSAPTAGNNSPLCVGSTLSLTATNSGGSTWNWTGPNGFTSNLQNPTIPSATLANSGTYSVTMSFSGCTGPPGTTNVTVSPIPAAPTAGANTTLCAGSTLSLTASFSAGATYSWIGPNSFTSNVQNPTIPAATTSASGVYSVNATIGGCAGPYGTISVTVNPIPTAPTASSNSTICAGSTLSLTALPNGASSYNWTGPNSFTSNVQNPTIAAATTSASGTYSVTRTVLGCTSPPGTTTVTVNPIPATPTAASNSTICAGSTLSLSALPNGAASYSWSGPNSFTSNVQNPTIAAATTSASGTYSVTQTVLGCTSPAGIASVTVNPIPAAPTAASNSTICAGSTLSLTASPNGANAYNWTGPNSFTSSLQNPTIGAATTSASGTYSVTQTVLGCTSPAGTTTVTVNPIPAAPTAASNSTICAGQTLSLTALPNGAASYNWSGPNTFTSNVQNPTIAGASTLASGSYSVTQTVLGCVSPPGVTDVTVNPIPAAPNASSNSTICAGSTLSLTALPNGANAYNWTGPNSFTSNVQNPTIGAATTSASGTYSVTQTVLGCTSPAGITSVTVNPIPSAPTAASNSTLCAGSTLSLSASPNGADSYDWTGPNSFTANVQNPTIVGATTLASGTYSVTQTINGCTGPAGIVNVTINAVPAAPAAANNSTICAGSTLSLSANPGGANSYSWNGPNGFTSNLQNPTIPAATTSASGTYSVTQTVLGCTSPVGTTTVTVSPIPAAPVAGSNSSLCAGQTLSLTASFTNGATYYWSGPNSFTANIQNPTIAPVTTSATGTYSVYVDIAGCAGPASTISVLINPIPAAPTAVSNSSICEGSTLSFTASPGGANSYSWNGPNGFSSNLQNPTIANASTLATGDYSVSQTVNGCTGPEGIVSVTVNPIPASPVGNSNSPVCGGGALIFTISPAGGIYSWTGPNSFTSAVQNPTISPAPLAATGNYSVTITLLGCTSPPAVINASVGAIPSAPNANGVSPMCVGSTLSLSATFSPGVNYVWSGPNSFTSAVQNPTMAGTSTLSAGIYTVYGSINGCDGPTSTVSIVVDVPAIVDVGKRQDTICSSALVIPLTGTVSGGGSTGGFWTSLGSGTFTPSNSLVTTYSMSPADMSSPSFELILTSVGGGCPAQRDTVRFIVLGPPLVDVGNNLNVCKNAYVTLTQTISGVTNTGTWTSTGSGTFTPNFGAVSGNTLYYVPSTADTSAGIIKLVLETTNNKGCASNKDSLFVTFIQAPKANFIHTNACATQTVAFTDQSAPAPNISNYSWNFGDMAGSSSLKDPVYTYSATGEYSVVQIVTLNNGCRDTARKVVTVYYSPLADFTYTNVCVGNQSSFFDASAFPAGSTSDTLKFWSWTFGDNGVSAAQNPLHLYNNIGTFPVNFTVTSDKGCSASMSKTVVVSPRPTAEFASSAIYVLAYDNVSFTDQSTPANIATWNWSFGNGNSTLQHPNNVFTDKGIYTVTLAVRDQNGCADTVTHDIYVTLLPMVPSAFTPNNDNVNDLLFVKGGPFRNMQFRVFNNWGEKVFETDNQDTGWDGKYKGEPAPLGVYVYILDVELYNGNKVRKTGDVTILK